MKLTDNLNVITLITENIRFRNGDNEEKHINGPSLIGNEAYMHYLGFPNKSGWYWKSKDGRHWGSQRI